MKGTREACPRCGNKRPKLVPSRHWTVGVWECRKCGLFWPDKDAEQKEAS